MPRAPGNPARCAPAWRVRTPAPEERALRAPRGAASASSVRRSRERRNVAEDRRRVAVAVEEHCDDDEREREAGRSGLRARPERAREREGRRAEHRPAERVVEEGRPLEEPRVLLVDEECDTRYDKSGAHSEPPPPALQLAAHERQFDRPG